MEASWALKKLRPSELSPWFPGFENHLTVVRSMCMANGGHTNLERVGASGHAVYVGAQTEAPGSCLLWPPTPVHMLTCQVGGKGILVSSHFNL